MNAAAHIRNNEGVDYILSGNFPSAIQSFQASLICFRSELEDERNSSDAVSESKVFDQTQLCSGESTDTPLFAIERRLPVHLQETVTYSSLKAFLYPIRMHGCQGKGPLSPSPQFQPPRDFSVAVTILNVAISFHLRSLAEPRTEGIREKAGALYDNAVQILENVREIIECDSAPEHLRALHDLLVMISLNNRLVLMQNCGNTDASGHMQRLVSVLVHSTSSAKENMDCSMSAAFSEWQQEFLTNLIVLKMGKPMSAPTA